MVNVVESLETIMKEYNLNKAMLSRATGYDYSSINRWCNGVRKPDIETLEHILGMFGYELNIQKSAKEIQVKPKNFYLEKSYEELKAMSIEDLADYVFVTQNEEVLSWLFNVPKDTLEYISIEKQRELTLKRIVGISRLGLYFRMNRMYFNMEEELGFFIERVKANLENNPAIPIEVLKEANSLTFNIYKNHVAEEFDKEYVLYDFNLIDKNWNGLDVSSDDIEDHYDCSGYSISNYLTCDLAEYFFETGELLPDDEVFAEVYLTY